jgi:hypothetical protein
VEDLLNADLVLRRLRETPARDSSMWEECRWYLPGENPRLQDWRVNTERGAGDL